MEPKDGPGNGVARSNADWEMEQGIVLLGRGEWRRALGHFDRAVMRRESMPWREDPDAAWGLAAAWINRSDALRRLEDGLLLPEAIRSLDRAIEVMACVPIGEGVRFAERLILAWINRATACGEKGDFEEALDGFDRAAGIFSEWGSEVSPNRVFLLAMLHLNRARVLLDLECTESGWREARAGLQILRGLEPGDGLIAQAGIRSRSILCRALVGLIESPPSQEIVGDWIAEATDQVEEALAIMRRTGLSEPSMGELVRCGARIYRLCQPQFLGEFLCECFTDGSPLVGDGALRDEMKSVVLLARHEAEQRLLIAPHDDAVVQREMRVIRALSAVSAIGW
jgi:tetratricopeptide (TPR) repeat protein